MAKTALSTIKNWFKTGSKPTQSQFWNVFDSFFHKDEKLQVSDVDQLSNYLNQKAEKQSLNNHQTNDTAHQSLFDQKQDKEEGKGLSEANFTAIEKEKLSALNFNVIAENQYGEHPAFSNQNELNNWILQKLNSTEPIDPIPQPEPTENEIELPNKTFAENYLYLISPIQRSEIDISQINLVSQSENAESVEYLYQDYSGDWIKIGDAISTGGTIWELAWTPSTPIKGIKVVATYANSSTQEVENVIYANSITDTFTDVDGTSIADHTPDKVTNSGWIQESGEWEIQNNKITDVSTLGGAHHLLTQGTKNAEITFKVDQAADAPAQPSGKMSTYFAFRYTDQNNFIGIVIDPTESSFKINSMVNGSATDIVEISAQINYSYGDTIRVTLVENTMVVFNETKTIGNSVKQSFPIELPAQNGTLYGIRRPVAVGILHISQYKLNVFETPKIDNSVTYTATKTNSYVIQKNQFDPEDTAGVSGPAFFKIGTTVYCVFPVKSSNDQFEGLMYATADESDPHNWTRSPDVILRAGGANGSSSIPDVTCHWSGTQLTLVYSDYTDGRIHYAQGEDINNLSYAGVLLDLPSTHGVFGRHPSLLFHDGIFYLYVDIRRDFPSGHFGDIWVGWGTTIEDLKTTDFREILGAPGFPYEFGDVDGPDIRYNQNNGYFEMIYAGFSSGLSPYYHEIGMAISKNPLKPFVRVSNQPLIVSGTNGMDDIALTSPAFYPGLDVIYYVEKDGDDTYGFDGIKYVELS